VLTEHSRNIRFIDENDVCYVVWKSDNDIWLCIHFQVNSKLSLKNTC
jgi:hypothetical protein